MMRKRRRRRIPHGGGYYCPKCLEGPYKTEAGRQSHIRSCRSAYTPHVRTQGLGAR